MAWADRHPDQEEKLDREGLAAGASCLPTLDLVSRITNRYLAGEDRNKLAWIFHAELARMITAACRQARKETGISTAALSGGCYQNTLLLSLSRRMLSRDGFRVLTHSMVPPNDGGICLGQAYGAAARMREELKKSRD